MNVDEIVDGLPVELQLVVLHFVVCAPKVHFLKPFKHYNGGLRKEPHGFARRRGRNGELGVEEVSPRSGANKLAKLFMEMSAGKSFPPPALGGRGPPSCVWSYPFSLNRPKLGRGYKKLTPI